MKTTFARIAPWAILILGFIGLADAAYLAQSELTGNPLICNIQGLSGCNIVAQSIYSHLFGIPLGIYGVGFYGLLFVLAAVELFYKESLIRKGIQALATMGILASICFVFIQVFLIKAICIYCTLSAIITLLVWLFALALPGFTLRRVSVPAVVAVALLLVITAPFVASASSFSATRSLVVSETPEGNAYFASGSLTVAAPISGDLSAIGGAVSVSAPVTGDALIAGGTVQIQKPVTGDARLLGGSVSVSAPIGGDLVATAGTFAQTSGNAKSMFIVAGTARLLGGASGPVIVYGSDVYLSGNFTGDVRVVASNKLTIAPDTHIAGALRYEAPETAYVPTSASVVGGVTYTGASFLPSSKEAQALALAGAGVFLFVKVLGAIIAVGLLAGLFPIFSEAIATKVLRGTVRRFMLYALLGFGITVATPILVFLLALTFVGFAVALIIGSAYVLALMLAYCYAGVIAGAALRERIFKQRYFSWRYAVLGMLVLSVVHLVPIIGPLVFFVLWAVALGVLASYAYERAFDKDD